MNPEETPVHDTYYPLATFRDRLRSQSIPREAAPPPITAKPGLLAKGGRQEDFCKPSSHFLEALNSFEDPKDDTVTRQLKRASKNACLKTHFMVVQELRQTHDELDKAISLLSEPANMLLSQTAALHENIERPLSATVCHSTSTPRASVATHCSKLQGALQGKQKSLETMALEWSKCIREEQALLERLEESEKVQSAANGKSDKAQHLVALEEEVRGIVVEANEAIDEIEQHFREAIQVETVQMISSMM
ncbi:hypothetical protein LIA77_07994 [Sarocladium implicatum]|nr:hypothetical protein LIA77_07994 [Sarocladium implicatum]